MEHLIQLNLHGDGERAEKAVSPKPERRDRESPAPRFKRLQRTSMGALCCRCRISLRMLKDCEVELWN